ncbi:MAG TPA: ABC transporter substrate-binding protein [Thermodesulfovibrionales bacterium]|nr:ABC transporter substrate-binding protein [Thermodesulfovibrionales bacterium]
MSLRDKPMKKYLMSIVLFFWVVIPFPVFAGVPLDTVKMHVDKVLDVLRDPSLKAESSKKLKRDKIRAIAETMFDFTELSKRTLAQNWSTFSPEQQKEFIGLYKSLLEDTYADKIMMYTDEKILFTKEVPLTEKTVEVQSTVIRKTDEIPMNYRVIQKEGAWVVYDVVVEGVSLINNYRSQFREILVNKPPESLLETLRKKVGKA